jgi:hypothetical protein
MPTLRAQPLALELTYQRNFTAEAIAKRSIEEMRAWAFTPSKAAAGSRPLQAAVAGCEAGRPPHRLVPARARACASRWAGKVVGEVPTLICAPVLWHLALAAHLRARAAPALATTRSTAGSP